MKRIPVYIPDEHHEEIRVMAFEKKTSMAEEVRKAVAEYLEKEREGSPMIDWCEHGKMLVCEECAKRHRPTA